MIIKTAKKTGTPYSVFELTHENFWNLKSLADGQYTTTEDGQKVKWADIKVISVNQENKNKFLFKNSYADTEFKTVLTLKKRQPRTAASGVQLKKLYSQKLNVPESKT